MRRFPRTTTILGGLALVAMLAFSSPGVRVVRAADEVATDAGEGAVCEAGSIEGANAVTAYLQELQQLQAEQVADRLAAPRSDSETIVLNNRGFNYDKPGFAFPLAGELDGE